MKSCCEYHRVNCNQGRRCPMRKPRHLIREKSKTVAFIAGFVLALGLMGRMDYEDELAAQSAARPTQTAQGGSAQ